MLIEHDGARPQVAESAYVAPNAVLCGDVTVGEECRVLFGAVLTAVDGPVVLGPRCIVMEQAVVRGRAGNPARLGERVLVGPHAHVNGAELADEVFIATGASVFPGARLGARSEVRINGVVHVNSVLPEDGMVPIGWIAAGDPAQTFPPEAHDALWEVQRQLDFMGTVGGDAARGGGGTAALVDVYVELYGRHAADAAPG